VEPRARRLPNFVSNIGKRKTRIRASKGASHLSRGGVKEEDSSSVQKGEKNEGGEGPLGPRSFYLPLYGPGERSRSLSSSAEHRPEWVKKPLK